MRLLSRCRFLAPLLVALCFNHALAQVRTIDPKQSSVIVHVSKSGVFSAFGHAHEIAAPVSGTVNASAQSVEITVNSGELKVLDPDRPASERAEVQRTMLGAEVLDAQRFPTVHFKSRSVQHVSPQRFVVLGDLTLHGETRPATIEVVLTSDNLYHATTTLKQTEFGIKPVTAAGGTVKVKNELSLEFTIAATSPAAVAGHR